MWGIALYAGSLYGFLVMSANIPLVLNRIRMEENLLAGAFGEDYRAYRKRVKKLIPFVY